MTAKRWIVRESEPEHAARLANALCISPILADLLTARCYLDQWSARAFLSPHLRIPARMIDKELAADHITYQFCKEPGGTGAFLALGILNQYSGLETSDCCRSRS